MTRTLSVWWDGVVVGTLQVNQHGQMRFTYASGCRHRSFDGVCGNSLTP